MLRTRIAKRKRKDSYTKMMKTLLLQNQQIIIQQQNMMVMVFKQFQQNAASGGQQHSQSSQQSQQPQHMNESQPTSRQSSQSQPSTSLHASHQSTSHHQQQHQASSQPAQSHQQLPHHQTSNNNHHHHHQQHQQHQHQQQHHHIIEEQATQQAYSHITSATMDTQQTMQQVASQLQQIEHENLGSYLTPAASEQDPISDDKQEEIDLNALLDGDGLLGNNMLYNPQTDIGVVTPYKNHSQQHQTPSYYSSGCESLTTPRVEQQRQPTTTNISQNVVKNLADSFKSPNKLSSKINFQPLSSSAREKASKAKIIQRMNISEFLRHVHPDKDS